MLDDPRRCTGCWEVEACVFYTKKLFCKKKSKLYWIGSKTDFCAMRCRSFTCMFAVHNTFIFKPNGKAQKKTNRTYQDQCTPANEYLSDNRDDVQYTDSTVCVCVRALHVHGNGEKKHHHDEQNYIYAKEGKKIAIFTYAKCSVRWDRQQQQQQDIFYFYKQTRQFAAF